MEKLDNNISSAKEFCNDIYYDEFSLKGFSKIYSFTTENIAGYIDYFNLKNKSLLTVGSSSDQVINAALKGCNDITLLDINPYIKYYYYLKREAIINLSYEEFFKFLKYKNYPTTFKTNWDNALDVNIYKRIRENLKNTDYESYQFWEELFSYVPGHTIRRNLFSHDEGQIKENRGCNPYLKSEKEFNEAKRILKKIYPTFINDDVINTELPKKYDNIWLSNIAVYLEENEIKQMVDNMDKYLRREGQMLVSYLYKFDEKRNKTWSSCPIIYNTEKVYELLSNYNLNKPIKLQSTDGIIFDDDSMKTAALTDCILTYKKKIIFPYQ